MTVLFSPIGTADPITQLGDGPMLHIVRRCRPDKVVLFLSPEMAKYQDSDGRYTRAIELLCDRTGQQLPEVVERRSPNSKVHLFDGYIKEFREVLEQIIREGQDEQILVNVSSGTPAMEEALVAIGALGEFDLELLQVTTPRRGPNKKADRENPDEYELDILWGLNPDNEVDAIDRVRTVELPNLKDRLLRKNIAVLVKDYDYPASSILARQLDKSDNSRGIRRRIDGLIKRMNLEPMGGDQLVEYLNVMEVRLRQRNWADFCRSLSPAFREAMKRQLQPYLPEDRYLSTNDDNVLDEEKIRADRRLEKALAKYIKGDRAHYLTDAALSDLVMEYCPNDDNRKKMRKLREFEKDCRNVLAHEITAVDKKKLERDGGMTLSKVMQYLYELNEVEKIQRGWYDQQNELLLKQLDK